MKKTIIALLALAGVAVGEDYTFTTSNTGITSASNFWGNGVALVLDPDAANSRLTTTVSPDGASLGDFDTVGLSSITINIRNLQNSKGIKLALTNSNGTILTLSDNVVTGTGNQEWTFSNTTVSTTDTLYFVYTAIENENVEVGYTLTTGGNGMVTIDEQTQEVTAVSDLIMCGASSLANYGSNNTAGVPTLAFLGTNNSRNFTLNNVQYAPYVTVVTTATIPEPATATLSLLALAGLAARRRRK